MYCSQKLATFAAIEQQRAKLQKLEGLCAALERDLPESLGLPPLPSLTSLNNAIESAAALVRSTCTADDTSFELTDAAAAAAAAPVVAATTPAADGDSARAAAADVNGATGSAAGGCNTESETAAASAAAASGSGEHSDSTCAAATSESDVVQLQAAEGDTVVQQVGESIANLKLEASASPSDVAATPQATPATEGQSQDSTSPSQ